jgi:hypothetical protein
MTMTKWLAAICLVVIPGVSSAQAQVKWEDRGYAAVNFGVQTQSREFDEVQAPPIYGERELITVAHEVAGGPFIDVAAGWRVWGNVAVGIGYSQFGDSESPTLTARIPHPLFGNAPRTATAAAGDLSHSESAIHLQLYWNLPQSEKFEVAIVVGPSFYTVKQDFIAAVTPQEGNLPFNTVTISSVAQTTLKEKAVGFTAGVDGTYLLNRRYGVGAFVRYSGASPEFNLDTGPVEVKAGGFQLGGGLRVRF